MREAAWTCADSVPRYPAQVKKPEIGVGREQQSVGMLAGEAGASEFGPGVAGIGGGSATADPPGPRPVVAHLYIPAQIQGYPVVAWHTSEAAALQLQYGQQCGSPARLHG